jgi:hypothetical protein
VKISQSVVSLPSHISREREREEKECAARGADADDEKGQKPSSREEYRATKAVRSRGCSQHHERENSNFTLEFNEHINIASSRIVPSNDCDSWPK